MTTRDFPAAPPAVSRRAQDWLDARVHGAATEAAVPRLAATVLLVRDRVVDGAESMSGVDVFVLRRVASMAFAPSTTVFPGGGVDARDADPDLPWSGPSPAEWARWLGCPETLARELVVAAAREVFEECGVLLAGHSATSVVGDVSDPEWHADREALLTRRTPLGELLLRRGLVLRSDLLSPRAHWVTPVFEPRRYDTYFFAALVPDGQVPDDATTEADVGEWAAPATLLADYAAGRARMLPPTVVCVEQVAAATSAAAFVAERPRMATIRPEPVHDLRGLVLRCRIPD